MSSVQVPTGQDRPPLQPQDPQRNDGGDGHDHGDGHDELPHLPPPSIRPLIMAIGLMVIAFGIVYIAHTIVGLILFLGGLLIFGIGLGGWIYDDIKEARRLNAGGGHSH